MKKIKIMHVVYIFELGGIETFILELCNNMDYHKYENYVVTLIDEKLGQIHLFNQNVKIINLNFKQGEIHSIRGFFKTLNGLINVIRSITPDVIHSHHEHYVGLFVQLASKLSKQRVVNVRTVHSGGSFYARQDNLSDFIKLQIERLTFRLFDVDLVAVSESIYQNNLKYFGEIAKNNTLIYNGVDIKRFDRSQYKNTSRRQFGLEDEDIVYVYVARLNPGKNHEFLINIWPEVVDCLPRAMLVFAGDGPLKQELVNLIKYSQVEKNVLMLGSIDNVPELLSVADIGVFPSLFEGMSISLLEKFAMKLPVVASDIEAFTNVATDNVDSFLIPLNDKGRFIETLTNLGGDENLRALIGSHAYNTALNYSIERTVSNYANFYSNKMDE